MSSERRSKHDVFVNFRGELRPGFVKSLHKALVGSGIQTFVDSEDLHKGQKISPALEKAIEQSRVAIVVFSPDYASSTWCLRELAKILECSKLKKQMVVTVFYKVKPSQVTRRTGQYGEAMAKHEQRHDSDTVEGWRRALSIASIFPGLHFEDNSDEAEFVKGVVEDVKTKLQHLEAMRKRQSLPAGVFPPPHNRHPHAFRSFGHDHFEKPSSIHYQSWQSPSMHHDIPMRPPEASRFGTHR